MNNSMKKRIIIIVSIVVVLAIAGFTLGIIINHHNNKALKVGFYNLEKEIVEPLKTIIQKTYAGEIKFTELSEQNYDVKKISRKYDLFFSWNGNAVEQLEKYSAEISSDCSQKLISSIKTQKNLPLLLDHYEMAYLTNARERAEVDFPSDFEEYMAYLFAMKNQVFIPFFTEGKDDDTLLGLISVQAEALCGTEGYKKLVSLINKYGNFYQVWEQEIGYSSTLGTSITLKYIMDGLAAYIPNDLSIANWTNATAKDVKTYASEKQIGVLFSSLSNHRKMDVKIMREYEADRMPVLSVKEDHCLIAPAVCVVNLSAASKKEIAEEILQSLVSDENQSYLSDETKLAPVNSRCRAFDVQADDVRYLAAIAPSGPAPDIANACFQTDMAKKTKFVEEIRKYLSGNTEK